MIFRRKEPKLDDLDRSMITSYLSSLDTCSDSAISFLRRETLGETELEAIKINLQLISNTYIDIMYKYPHMLGRVQNVYKGLLYEFDERIRSGKDTRPDVTSFLHEHVDIIRMSLEDIHRHHRNL